MKYASILAFVVGVLSGTGIGYYYGTKQERKKAEAEIESVKDEFNNKLSETRLKMIELMKEDESDEQPKMTPNGDIEDSPIQLIEKEEYGYDPNYRDEDIVYYANDKVWYNRDLEKTYNQNDPKDRFDFPKDLFSHFGVGEGKKDYVYLADKENKVYYCVEWSEDSYVSEVLGYDSKEV